MSSKRFLFICVLILSLCSLTIQSYGEQGKQLSHVMTEEERALMPAYLESLRDLRQTLPPPVPVRNIAEFEQMEGVLIAYPLGIPLSLVAEMSEDVMVTTIVDDTSEENVVINLYSSAGVNMNNCNFLHAPHDSYWTRDYGPWFVTDGNRSISIMNFTYNRPRYNDNNIPIEMADFLGLDLYEMDLVHTGGNYMTDAWGISVSTDLVWEENNNYTTQEIDQIMNDYLGIHTYHVTNDPLGDYIKHVDCWGKYLDVDKILISRLPPSDPQYSEYEAIVDYFANQTSGYGNNYQVYRVDTPDHQPYTNSLILNKRVFVPIMGSPDDADAILAYETAMPGYEVIGISGNWISTDALHCRVIGIADRGMLYIEHSPLLGKKPEESQYEITAEIIPYSGMPLISDSVKIYYQVNGGPFYTVNMSHTSGDTYTGNIPGQSPGSEIAYYLHASDTSGQTSEHPFIGAPDPHLFTVTLPPPDAEFSADNTIIIEGQGIHFTDQSTNNPTQWSWSFPGGTPSGSMVQHPIVTYDNQGTYSVTLTAYNSTGSDTETKVDYITVLPAGSCFDNSDCDDGLFCNGTETCVRWTCQAGTPPDCDDGVSCTEDSCNEGTDSCDHTANDSLCDNGLFCDGTETCDPVLDCQPGIDPCDGGACNEVNDRCVKCGKGICDKAYGEHCSNYPKDYPGDGLKEDCCGNGICEKFEGKRGTCPEDCG